MRGSRMHISKTSVIAAVSLLAVSAPIAVRADVEIREVRLLEFEIGRQTAFVTSRGSSTTCYGIFVLIHAEEPGGKSWTGVGEVLPRTSVTSESREDAWAGAQAMRSSVLGKRLQGRELAADMWTLRGWLAAMHRIAVSAKLTWERPPADPSKNLRATLCGFDMALLDLVGQVHGKPIYELLGGKRREAVSLSAPTLNADIAPEEVAATVAGQHRAYTAVRMKVGTEDELDVRRIHAAARAIIDEGRGRELWADVNQGWKTPEHSLGMLRRIRNVLHEVGYSRRFVCEQPTVETDIEALAKVTRQTRAWNRSGPPETLVMADECMWTLRDAQRIAATDAADLVNIKIVKAGGLLPSMEIASYLHEHAPHTGVYIGGVLMTDIAATANLHLAYAVPRLDYVTGCFPRRAYAANPATKPLLYCEGTRTLVEPEGSGLGLGVSLDVLRPYMGRAVP